MTAALDHIEKTLADAYRKEIDQEENVWRSLPFFAASLALQTTVLATAASKLGGLQSGAWWDGVACLAIIVAATVIALGFLTGSIWPANFRYISSELELLAYAEGLEAAEREADRAGLIDRPDAISLLKRTLAREYATATGHNRRINQARVRRRSVAGIAVLVSVLATLILVTTVGFR